MPEAAHVEPLSRQTQALALNQRARVRAVTQDVTGALEDLSVILAQDISPALRFDALRYRGILEANSGDPARALETEREAYAVAMANGALGDALMAEANSTCSLRELGRCEEAKNLHQRNFHKRVNERPLGLWGEDLVTSAEDYALLLIDLGRYSDAGLVFGAAEAARDAAGLPRDPLLAAEQAPSLAKVKRECPEWEQHVLAGRQLELGPLLQDLVPEP